MTETPVTWQPQDLRKRQAIENIQASGINTTIADALIGLIHDLLSWSAPVFEAVMSDPTLSHLKDPRP